MLDDPGKRWRRTDEEADLAEASFKDLVLLVARGEVILLGPPEVALLVPADDLSVPVDVGRDVLEDRPRLGPFLARLVALDLDFALEPFAFLVDRALDDGSDDDVDFDFFGEVLEGREPVLRRGGLGRCGVVQVGVGVRVLGEVPVLAFTDDATQLQRNALRSLRSGGKCEERVRTKYSGKTTSSAPWAAACLAKSCARWKLSCDGPCACWLSASGWVLEAESSGAEGGSGAN